MLENYIEHISFPVNKILFDNYAELGIDERDLVILIRILEDDNSSHTLPDIERLQQGTTLSKNDISKIIQTLLQKELLTLNTTQENDKYIETVSFDPLYQKLIQVIENGEKEPAKGDIKSLFSYVEQLYGRALSPNEFERMNSWLNDSKYDTDQIEEAVDIAYKNQVTSLSYVERVLQNLKKSPPSSDSNRPPVKNWLKEEE